MTPLMIPLRPADSGTTPRMHRHPGDSGMTPLKIRRRPGGSSMIPLKIRRRPAGRPGVTHRMMHRLPGSRNISTPAAPLRLPTVEALVRRPRAGRQRTRMRPHRGGAEGRKSLLTLRLPESLKVLCWLQVLLLLNWKHTLVFPKISVRGDVRRIS